MNTNSTKETYRLARIYTSYSNGYGTFTMIFDEKYSDADSYLYHSELNGFKITAQVGSGYGMDVPEYQKVMYAWSFVFEGTINSTEKCKEISKIITTVEKTVRKFEDEFGQPDFIQYCMLVLAALKIDYVSYTDDYKVSNKADMKRTLESAQYDCEKRFK